MSSVRSEASACSWSGSASLRMYSVRRRCSEVSCCGDTTVSRVRSVRLGSEAMAAAVSAGHRSAWERVRGESRMGQEGGGRCGLRMLSFSSCAAGRGCDVMT